jgi:predicted ATP-dependent endonuclease of OLD family
MHIQALRIRNFRRLKNARVDFQKDISIFVGANNSGKTSAAHAIGLFLGDENGGLAVHDFNAETWEAMNAFGNEEPNRPLKFVSAPRDDNCLSRAEASGFAEVD